MHDRMILHADPPITWDQMCGTRQEAIISVLLFEGLANDAASAQKLATSGEIEFSPCNEHDTVELMAVAPVIVQLVGGDVTDALAFSKKHVRHNNNRKRHFFTSKP